jgi:hypothetical protein
MMGNFHPKKKTSALFFIAKWKMDYDHCWDYLNVVGTGNHT